MRGFSGFGARKLTIGCAWSLDRTPAWLLSRLEMPCCGIVFSVPAAGACCLRALQRSAAGLQLRVAEVVSAPYPSQVLNL